eukprot:4280147-Alexandrium_andersonii.AAC.1
MRNGLRRSKHCAGPGTASTSTTKLWRGALCAISRTDDESANETGRWRVGGASRGSPSVRSPR